MKLLINEIFYSIQGEGPNAGKPAVFLRLAGCNFKCKWCDTKHALRVSAKCEVPSAIILKKIKKYKCKHLVITGGEPTLQQDGLVELLKNLSDYYVEIETNGSIPLKKQFEHTLRLRSGQVNCSPKLKNSGNKPYPLQIKPANKKAIYKFVVAKKSDLKEIENYIKSNKIPKDRVWLMPEGVNKKIVQERSKWIIEICKKNGYNFSSRLHIIFDIK